MLIEDRSKPHTRDGGIHVHPRGASWRAKGGFGRWKWCPYCYRNVCPQKLVEAVNGKAYEMALCPRCDAGLTPPTPTTMKGLIP